MKLLLAGAAVATGAAWLLLDAVPLAQQIWATVLLVPLPVAMVLQARQLERMEPIPRAAAYTSTIISLWTLLLATLLVARLSGVQAAEIGLRGAPLAVILVGSAVLTAAAAGLLFLFRAWGVREGKTVRWLMPVTPAERKHFILVSISAGVCEEIVFRGFLLHVLATAGAGTLVAVTVSSSAFGVLHAYQHPVGALRAAVLGALLAVPPVLGYGLLPSIIAHSALDVLSGLWLSRYLLR